MPRYQAKVFSLGYISSKRHALWLDLARPLKHIMYSPTLSFYSPISVICQVKKNRRQWTTEKAHHFFNWKLATQLYLCLLVLIDTPSYALSYIQLSSCWSLIKYLVKSHYLYIVSIENNDSQFCNFRSNNIVLTHTYSFF